MPECLVIVTYDPEGCKVAYPDGEIDSVRWNELERVEIHTNDAGPWFADLVGVERQILSMRLSARCGRRT